MATKIYSLTQLLVKAKFNESLFDLISVRVSPAPSQLDRRKNIWGLSNVNGIWLKSLIPKEFFAEVFFHELGHTIQNGLVHCGLTLLFESYAYRTASSQRQYCVDPVSADRKHAAWEKFITPAGYKVTARVGHRIDFL